MRCIRWVVGQIDEMYQVGLFIRWVVAQGLLLRWMRCIRWVVAQVDQIYFRWIVAQVDQMYLRWA